MNNNLKKDIIEATRIINNKNTNTTTFGEYSNIYRFANEPLNNYSKYLKNKEKILIVTGSSDQILKCITYDTKYIDTFDISNFPKYFLDLKIAACQTLTRDEFYDFFYSNEFDSPDKTYLYYKFNKNLPSYSKIFWDTLIENYNWSIIYNSKLFTHRTGLGFNNKQKIIENYSFLQEEEYKKLQENSKKVTINSYVSNINEISSKINNSYDLVFLSNVIDYVPVKNFLEYI